MSASLSVNTTNLQYAVLTIDGGGTKPVTIWKYRIFRKENAQADSFYYELGETTTTSFTDHPRPRNLAGGQISWAYRVQAYVFGVGWSSGTSRTVTGVTIAAVTDAEITSSGVLGAATSAGTFSNTYLAQAESKPTGSTNLDQETWVICEILPLTVSSA
tara:strand:+ start:11492 stop:11968 length:477 start_codon:yes stop_codon:yes gene_type:complete